MSGLLGIWPRGCTCRGVIPYRRYTTSTTSPSPAEGVSAAKRLRKSDWKRRQEGSNFVDTLSLNVHSGRGGAGGVAFHRDKFLARGPPSGGPGGQGGSVYLVASPTVTSLAHLPRTVRGGTGQSGGGKWLGGKRGEDVVIRVPVGTIVKEVRVEIPVEIEKERADREQLEWAWDASKIRLAEAQKRERRWDAWKSRKDQLEKQGEKSDPFEELDEVEVDEHKQLALEETRKNLFVMYPGADLASHPYFLESEHQLLSKLLSRPAASDGKKTRRRQHRIVTEEEPLYLDLAKPTPLADPILLLSGGQGGLGNSTFQQHDDRSPKYATKGREGESLRLELEVKAGGEVGLVGMPNAGKSTLLRALTSSTPRIASYAFTTLNPHQGTCVLYSDGSFSGPRASLTAPITNTVTAPETFSGTTQHPTRAERRATSSNQGSSSIDPLTFAPRRSEVLRFTLTDNPGLVARASDNVGLGLAFLRHVERCRALVYVVDLSSPDPVAALEVIRTELAAYAKLKGLEDGDSDTSLLARVRGVVANKADMFGEPAVDEDDEEGADPSTRATAADGQRKLAELVAHVRAIEKEEIELGIRPQSSVDGHEGIWVVPVSAKRRENVGLLVQKLAATVKAERQRAAEREALAEAEAVAEEEAKLTERSQ